MNENGPRTHEPSLRELTAELDGVRDLILAKLEALKIVIDERDRLYKERDEARSTATKASFDASEKAIVKAEDAQKAYNMAHNDLARKMDDQNKATVPRLETEARFRNVEEKIAELREKMSSGEGTVRGVRLRTDETRANLAILIAFAGLSLTALVMVFGR